MSGDRELHAYLDGELGPERLRELEARLIADEAAAAELGELQALSELLEDAVPLPDELAWARFERGLQRELGRETRKVLPGGALQRWLLVGAALAACFLITTQLADLLSEPRIALAGRRLPSITLPHREPSPRFAPAPELPPLDEVAGAELAPTYLSSAGIAALGSHGLVQVPSPAKSLSELYPLRRPPGVDAPRPLATADASLLLFGAVSARAALALEREQLIPRLRELLRLLCDELQLQVATARGGAVREGAQAAWERLAVAARLHGLRTGLRGEARARVETEADRIRAAQGTERSEVLGRELDYRAFQPRGIYQGDPLLRTQAQVARWLSLSGFLVDPAQPGELRAACLLTLALAHGQLPGGGTGLAGQARLEAAIELLYGEPDELTPFDLLRSIRQGLGRPTLVPSDLDSESALAAVLERAELEAGARGLDRIRSQDDRLGCFLLGNTRSSEAQAFSELTAPLLPDRSRPASLDLLVLLGSRRARTCLSAQRGDSPRYDLAMQRLRARTRSWRDPAEAVPLRASLERGRLWAIGGLFRDGSARALPFHTAPYRDRLVLAGLAGLNGPQAGGDGAWEEPRRGEVPLVEPLPRFHARLAFSARRLALALEGLNGGSPALGRAVRALREVAALEEALRDASLDLLEGRAPAPGTEAALARYPDLLRLLGPPALGSAEDVFELRLRDGSTQILHRIVPPRLDALYLITLDPRTRRPCLARGVAISAAERWVPGRRLSLGDLASLTVADPIWASHVERR